MVDLTQITITDGGLAAIAALGVSFIIILCIVLLAAYIYCAIALMTIARKTKTPNAWMAWIPFVNFYLLTQIAKVSALWTLVLLAFLALPFGGWVVFGIGIWMFWRVSERRNLPGWISLLLIVPIVNFVILGIIAWYKK